MRWFAKKSKIVDEDHLLVDWDDAVLDEPTVQHRDPAVRKLINGASILVVILLIGASAHWWLGPAANVWTTVFPPPPYTGALVYGMSNGTMNSSLAAFRFTDGHEQWRINNIGSASTVILYDTNTIYTVDTDTRNVQALRAQTGKQIWHMTTDSSHSLDSGWLANNRLYLLVNAGTTSPLLEAVDAPTGHILWTSALHGANPFLVGFHADSMLFCATDHVANTAPTTLIMSALDSQTGALQWQQSAAIAADGSYSCGENGDVAFFQNFGNTLENTLTVVDEQTGSIQRQIRLFGQIMGADHHVIFTFTTGPQSNEQTSIEQEVQAVSLDTGKLLWHLIGNYSPVFIDNEASVILPSQQLIAADTTGLLGLSQQTGAVVWHWQNAEINANYDNLNPAVAGDDNSLYFASQAHMYALDSATGKLRWQAPLPPVTSPIIQYLYAAPLLFISHQGQFQALQASNGKTRWQQNIVLQNIFCLQCRG